MTQTLAAQLKRLESALCATAAWSRNFDPSYDVIRLSFTGGPVHYVLELLPNFGTAQLSTDPNRDLPSCPLIEYSFRFTHFEIGDSAYGPELAIRFYDGKTSMDDLRLTLTHLPGGRWYTWANSIPTAYPGQSK